ncbi:D-alanyl-D-alanine dipeptidase [Alicyclobacillus cellulosilyticus]|uniref:D-alanyl-D-alanine dipeptidase n=1 Tax=Alicyclobacillus cellulosilyticus TaxID=1003997 RepID=A0A917KBD5_9BACL|nr:M15 family metallopeptidase [Alicyclobacillus cellulosilyticus]GGJ04160.1 D-alanyl-D-alanine dipeptidase [Alicyclobacillus cellulosilyticus]
MTDRQDCPAPIPPLRSVDGFRDVPIAECGEPLRPIPAAEKLRTHPVYWARGIPGAEATLWAREGVIARLLHAAAALPDGIALVVFDAWRPLAVQQYLFDEFAARLAQRTGLTGEALARAVARYVSVPSRDPRHPSAHATGGAVDVGLCTTDGRLLHLGTAFDAFVPEAATRWLEEHAQSEAERQQRDLRRILFHAMTKAGFTNYPDEWWHYDYGNQFYGRVRGVPAMYGYIEREASV